MGDKAIITMIVEKESEGYGVDLSVINACIVEMYAAFDCMIKHILEKAEDYNIKTKAIGELTRILVEASQEGE